MKKPTQAELSTNSFEVVARHYPEWAKFVKGQEVQNRRQVAARIGLGAVEVKRIKLTAGHLVTFSTLKDLPLWISDFQSLLGRGISITLEPLKE